MCVCVCYYSNIAYYDIIYIWKDLHKPKIIPFPFPPKKIHKQLYIALYSYSFFFFLLFTNILI